MAASSSSEEQRARIATCLWRLEQAASSETLDGCHRRVAQARASLTDAVELRPSLWAGMKAVPKGGGKGELPFTPGLGPARYDSEAWHAEQERRYAAMQRKADGKAAGKAAGKGKGEGDWLLLTPGEGERGSWVRARSRSPVPDWVAVAGGDRMPVTPPVTPPE